jgi:anti-anti-sigma factor
MPPDAVKHPDVPVLAPVGDLDLVTSRDLAARLGELAGSHGDAVLDLSDIAFMDSVGLGVVVKAAGRFQRQDKRLVLVAPPGGRTDRLLELTAMRSRLDVAETRDEALALVARRP